MVLAPAPNGHSRIAWTDTAGLVHLTPLDERDARQGPDAVTSGNSVRGAVALADRTGVLIQRDDEMVLVVFDLGGDVLWEHRFIGGASHTEVGDKWIDDWPHDGRLAWDGTRWIAYFGHNQLWSSGKHQGDMLAFVSESGERTNGGWSWGCSHSTDVRLAAEQGVVAPVCLSDCYPQKAIMLNHNTPVMADPTGNCQGTNHAQLGGLARLSDGYGLSHGDAEGSVWWSWLPDAGAPSQPMWVAEGSHPHLASYLSGQLITWETDSQTWAMTLDKHGTPSSEPSRVSWRLAPRDDLVRFANGDIGSAGLAADGSVEVLRIRACSQP